MNLGLILIIMICVGTAGSIISKELLYRMKNKKNRQIADHLKNQNEKTLPEGSDKQYYKSDDTRDRRLKQ